MFTIGMTNYRIETNFASPCHFKHRAVIRAPRKVGLNDRLEMLQAILRKPVLAELIGHPILTFFLSFYSILSVEFGKGFASETR
jgi:hypothetical protein